VTTPDPLAALDAEETRLLTELAQVRSAKATLRRVCGSVDPPHGPLAALDAEETPPGKPVARPPTGEPGTEPRGRPRDPGRPLRIARAMLAGPLSHTDLLAATGEPTASLHRALTDPVCRAWWRKQGGHYGRWELTPEGRAAASSTG